MAASTDPPVFGTIWSYEGVGRYMAVSPTLDKLWADNGWDFLSLEYPNGLVTLAGFYGGDPEKRLSGYKRLDEEEK